MTEKLTDAEKHDRKPEHERKGGEAFDADGKLDESLKVESVVVPAPEDDPDGDLVGDIFDPAPPVVVDGDPFELVEMWNPETPGADTSTTTRQAFAEQWAEKGWKLVKGVRSDGGIVIDPEGDGRAATQRSSTGSTDTKSDASTGPDSGSEAAKVSSKG
jgi:hypothetical protein